MPFQTFHNPSEPHIQYKTSIHIREGWKECAYPKDDRITLIPTAIVDDAVGSSYVEKCYRGRERESERERGDRDAGGSSRLDKADGAVLDAKPGMGYVFGFGVCHVVW